MNKFDIIAQVGPAEALSQITMKGRIIHTPKERENNNCLWEFF